MAEGLFTDAELNALSDELVFARQSQCQIYRATEVRDAGGAKTKTWAAVGGAQACRVEAQTRVAQEQVFSGRITPVVFYAVYFGREVQISSDDRILVDGITLEVTGVPGLETYYAELRVNASATSDAILPA